MRISRTIRRRFRRHQVKDCVVGRTIYRLGRVNKHLAFEIAAFNHYHHHHHLPFPPLFIFLSLPFSLFCGKSTTAEWRKFGGYLNGGTTYCTVVPLIINAVNNKPRIARCCWKFRVSNICMYVYIYIRNGRWTVAGFDYCNLRMYIAFYILCYRCLVYDAIFFLRGRSDVQNAKFS